MLREKGGNGFPYLIWMDANGDVIAKQGKRSVEAFEESRAKVHEYEALKKKADSGDAKARTQLFMSRLEMGTMKASEVQRGMDELKLDPAQRKKAEQAIVNLEVGEVFASVRSRDDLARVTDKLIAMKNAGKLPTGDMAMQFWNVLLGHADQQRDAEAFAEALDALKKIVGDNPRAAQSLKKAEDRLQELRDQSGQKKDDGDEPEHAPTGRGKSAAGKSAAGKSAAGKGR